MKTVSLEIAKELKSNGFPQETFFAYGAYERQDGTYLDDDYILKINPRTTNRIEWGIKNYAEAMDDFIASPTAEEILERTPHQLLIKDVLYQLTITKINGWTWGISYIGVHTNKTLQAEVEDSLAEAAGECWLFLKKENLL